MAFEHLTPPTAGTPIKMSDSGLNVPNEPILPFIQGDGTGRDIWKASVGVFDAAVAKAYGGSRRIEWFPVYAGQESYDKYGTWLPEDTVNAFRMYLVGIKGPLTTPIGGGIRSLNVALRQQLDLYTCLRPIRYFDGVPSPVRAPEKVNMVIYRENTEDVYAGIEWKSGTDEANKVRDFLKDEMGKEIRPESGIGIKPISPFGSKRLVRRAIQFAIANKRDSVTLVHKGNIMKFTEGAFKEWGYEVARDEFSEQTINETDLWDKHDGKLPEGKILIKDRIADAMFQQVLLRPDEYSVLAATNLNGDYISDALAAQVGGLGLAPGSNESDEIAFFEATHGTAPKYAGQDKVNPGSLILSGVMMLRHLGWIEAADAIERAIEKTIEQKRVTYDLERQMEGATLLKTSEFGQAIIENL